MLAVGTIIRFLTFVLCGCLGPLQREAWFSIELTFRLDDEWSPQGSGDSTFEVLRIGAGITSLCILQ